MILQDLFRELNKLDEEVKHTVLYHKTSLKNGLLILLDNTIKTSSKYVYNEINGPCICLSRSFKFIQSMPQDRFCIFVLNKDELKTNYRLYPISDYKNSDTQIKARFDKEESKAEELVKRDITNVTNYIDEVIINDSDYDLFMKYVNQELPNCKIKFIKFSEYKLN